MPSSSTYQKIPFTQDAYEKMQKDLALLLQEEQAILERLRAAREMGDLSENGAYKYAKFELGNVRRKIRRLHYLLQHGEIVAKVSNPTQVRFGTTVLLLSEEKQVAYTLVSKHESYPRQGKLSQESPLGQALLGKSVGDVVALHLPTGTKQYTILAVK